MAESGVPVNRKRRSLESRSGRRAAAAATASPRTASRRRSAPSVHPAGIGFSAEGPDFYTWQEDPTSAESWASELRVTRR